MWRENACGEQPPTGKAHARNGVVRGSRLPISLPSTLAWSFEALRSPCPPRVLPRYSFSYSSFALSKGSSVWKSIVFTSGRNRDFAPCTVHARLAVPVNGAPTRKNTCPDCPSLHRAPVPSVSGLTEAGAESAYCHHATASAL